MVSFESLPARTFVKALNEFYFAISVSSNISGDRVKVNMLKGKCIKDLEQLQPTEQQSLHQKKLNPHCNGKTNEKKRIKCFIEKNFWTREMSWRNLVNLLVLGEGESLRCGTISMWKCFNRLVYILTRFLTRFKLRKKILLEISNKF